MNHYALLPLGAFVLNLILWTFVFASARPSKQKYIYLLFVALCALWGLSDFLIWNIESPEVALTAMRIASFTWLVPTYLYLRFAGLLSELKYPRWLHPLTVLVAFFTVVAAATPWILSSVEQRVWGWVPQPGPLYGASIAIGVFLPGFLSMFVIGQRLKTAEGVIRKQLQMFITGALLSWLGAVVVNVGLVLILNMKGVPSLGSTMAAIQVVFVFIASSRYRFLGAGVEDAAIELFAKSNDGIIFIDLRNQITDINNAALQILNRTRAECIERPIVYIMPDSFVIDATAQKQQEIVFAGRDADTEALVSVSELYLRKRLAGHIISFRDISDMKRAARIREQNRALEIEVQRSQDRKMVAMGQLASGMIHNFNNILTGVLGYASLLKHRIGDRTELQVPLEGITGAVHSAMSTSRNLLDFARSRPEEIDGSLWIRDKADVHQCIATAAGLLRHASDTELSIDTVLNARICHVPGSYADIENTLLNLFINAADAMNRKGTIRVQTCDTHLETDDPATGMLAGDYLCIDVADTGPGIAQEILPLIFEPFFSTKKHSSGTGLGLSSAWGLVRKHRGRIEVLKTDASGTVFRIWLPLS